MIPRADPDQVLAFRLAGHNLARRLPPGSLLAAAGACGVQNSPPGSAALALAARVADLTPAEVARAIEADRTLVQMRSIRAAPLIFPTRDLPVFATGLQPTDEGSLRHFIIGAGPALDRLGTSAGILVDLTAAALLDVLDGRTLPFRQLSRELTERVASRLPAGMLGAWRSPGGYAPGQSLGEALIHFALYVVALRGLYVYGPRADGEASFARTDQWLGEAPPTAEPDAARAELLRRYLRLYGPSTAERFGEWTGISPADVGRAWRLVEPDLVTVALAGRTTWLHRRDLGAFGSPPAPAGVRLLPPHDPYLDQRDRETLLPDPALRRLVWRRVGNPGVVLAAGRIVGLWRARKTGRRLALSVEPLAPLADEHRSEIVAEAEIVAAFRGCETAAVVGP